MRCVVDKNPCIYFNGNGKGTKLADRKYIFQKSISLVFFVSKHLKIISVIPGDSKKWWGEHSPKNFIIFWQY